MLPRRTLLAAAPALLLPAGAARAPVLGAARTGELIAACRRLGALADVRELAALAAP